jgi:ubiquitin-protein ligase
MWEINCTQSRTRLPSPGTKKRAPARDHTARLSSFRRKWMERKSDALFDFVVYRKKSGSTTRLLCGIPGPKRTPWEGGLFPVLMTCFSDPDQPPKCQYPPDFHHVNVYPSGLISASTVHPELDRHHEISIPELLFSLQKHLAHPFPDSTTHSPRPIIATKMKEMRTTKKQRSRLKRTIVKTFSRWRRLPLR